MKINGIEITDKQELKMLKKDSKILLNNVKTLDWDKGGLAASHDLHHTTRRINVLTINIKIEKLYQDLCNSRRSIDFDRIQSKIDKLRIKRENVS